MSNRAADRAGSASRPGARYTPLVSAVLLIGSLGSAHDNSNALLPVLVLAGIAVTCLPLAWSYPRAALPIAGAAVGIYFALNLPNGPLFVILPGVAFIAARQVPWPRLWPLVGLPLLLFFAGLTLRVLLHDGAGFVTTWQAIGVTALTLGAMLAGARLTERQELRSEQAKRSATEEQLRMAQGLHDGVGHGLAVIAMHAQVALHVLDKTSVPAADDARLRQSLEAIRSSSQDSLTALRRELAVMSSGAAARAPAPGLSDLRPLLDRVRSGGLIVDLPSDVPLASEVPDEVGRVVYAVVQESLTNVLRHAQAQRAIVTFRNSGGRLTVTIADDGVGRANPAGPLGSLGLAGPAGSGKLAGLAEAVGPAGLAEAVGPAGLAEAVGPAGLAEEVGPAGLTGLASSPGLAETAASASSAGLLSASAGSPTSTGSAGPTGPPGSAVSASPAGLAGSVGSAGIAGSVGPAELGSSADSAGLAGAVGSAGVAGSAGSAEPVASVGSGGRPEVGLGVPAAAGSGGLGIAGLRNRVEKLGGHLETPAVPRGFVLSATLPVATVSPARGEPAQRDRGAR